MKKIHTPNLGLKYWLAISMASIFGTNTGDLYAHESGLGIVWGIGLLAILFALTYVIERKDMLRHTAYYWTAIIIVRTAATNLADFMAWRMHINPVVLVLTLSALLAGLAWYKHPAPLHSDTDWVKHSSPPGTDLKYWFCMLLAGIVGTIAGDMGSHFMGGGVATLVLGAILAVILIYGSRGLLATLSYYWFAIVWVRTAGTAAGDWIAENEWLQLGVPLSTLCTGIVFVLILVLWQEKRRES